MRSGEEQPPGRPVICGGRQGGIVHPAGSGTALRDGIGSTVALLGPKNTKGEAPVGVSPENRRVMRTSGAGSCDRRPGRRAVSYTHLDVYKRQELDAAIAANNAQSVQIAEAIEQELAELKTLSDEYLSLIHIFTERTWQGSGCAFGGFQ